MEELPASRINDGYCDCWETGEDERNTDACAGIEYWGYEAGIDVVRCVHGGLEMILTYFYVIRPMFQCPQQAELRLPVSRVNDGICDCCDGADEEIDRNCPDSCAEIKAAEAAARAELQERYAKGSKIRIEAVEAFQKLKAESESELETLQSELETEKSNVDLYSDELLSAKLDFAKQRIDRLKQSTTDGTFKGLTEEELKLLIVHSCQLSGELSLNGSNCEALQLAALEVGIGFEKPLPEEELADVVYHNAQNPDSRVFTLADLRMIRKKKKGRRLMRVVAAEDYPDGVDEYEEDYDDYSDDYHTSEDDDQGETSKSEGREAIEQLPFSATRVHFLARVAELQKIINEAASLRDSEALDDEMESAEPEELELQAKAKELAAVDDKTFGLLKSSIEDRIRVIERGFNFAESAKSTVDQLTDDSILEQIALGTIYHGKLSAVHVYQILASILFQGDSTQQQTCTNVAGIICPPKTTVRNGVTVPSNRIVEAVTMYCDGASLPDIQKSCAEEGAIPTEIEDGYAGYYEVFPREEGEEWHKKLEEMFSTTDKELAMLVDIAEKEVKSETVERKVKDLEQRIKDINDSIGADDVSKFGPDGALHSIRSECFSIKAGKYTYELCMYSKAAQKDGSSTNLGQWAGASVDDEVGHVWRWEEGAKCWNGPKRSATAYVTCGAETVVLSADEPDTCRYVFQVRSPTACDESFRLRHKL